MSVYRSEKKNNYTRISNSVFKDTRLSLKATGILCLMLSLPDDWDYSVEGLAKLVKDGKDSVKSALKELEKSGYLVRKRHRLPNGCLDTAEYNIYEEPISVDKNANAPETENPLQVFPQVDSPSEEEQPQLMNNLLKTNSINEGNDMIARMRECCEYVENKIDYDYLCEKYGIERVNEVVGIIVDTVVSNDPLCRIERSDVARELVRDRYNELERSHIEFVFESMSCSGTEIRNIKHYLQTALYNAPVTMKLHQHAKVDCENNKWWRRQSHGC